jgi:tRNA (cytidine/uridine-2'-O-)-methyltransferase
LFGSETSGLPESVLKKINIDNQLRIPMITGSRSLNLSNSVAVTIYEALRQNSFDDLV